MNVRPVRLVLAALLALQGGLARAQPEDPLGALLRERGLVEARAVAPDRSSDLVVSALAFLGVRYRRGGESFREGFDCSGFTRHVFEHSLGLALPRRSQEQALSAALSAVEPDELRPGDLVFFNTVRAAFSHVGIYIGEGRFIHAPRSGAQVRLEDMRLAYWRTRYDGARRARVPQDAPTPPVLPVAPAAAPPFDS